MKPIYDPTPLYESAAVNARLGRQVHFKMDCHLPSLSFKLRGMAHFVAHHVAAGRTDFVASSGGNAGYSLAWAARRLGGRVHVVVPASAPARMRARIAGEGATVEVHGAHWPEADAHARALVAQTGAVYVSPFDDPLLWAGHATLIDEAAQQMSEPDLVIAAVGGGGLLCGIMEGMVRNGWSQAEFLAAETEGAASMAHALAMGHPEAIERIDTVAGSLGARLVAQEAWAWSQRRPVRSHICSDDTAVTAVQALLDEFQVLVEPACGAALSAVLTGDGAPLGDAERVLVVVCGGAGWTLEAHTAYLARMGK